jgi:hypothetical protein
MLFAKPGLGIYWEIAKGASARAGSSQAWLGELALALSIEYDHHHRSPEVRAECRRARIALDLVELEWETAMVKIDTRGD